MSEEFETIRQRALVLLARREHSEKELLRKLAVRSSQQDMIPQVISQLKQEGLQSDRRFADAFVHNRIERGSGPIKISHELQEKGINDELIAEFLMDTDVDWTECIIRVREKKFGHSIPGNFKEQAKQSRFLQSRGFSGEQIRNLFNKC